MNLTKMAKFDPQTPGPYWYLESEKTPVVVCTNGHQSVVMGHIGVDGRVSPSFQCAYGNCTFHEHIVLEGWGPAIT